MSQETITWLNQMTLIGFTEKRGKAWHYKAAEQGDETNHYIGAVPVEDVRRRLFDWQAQEGTVRSDIITPDGVTTITDDERKAIIRPAGALGVDDRGGILGVFKQGYQIHQYDEWLLEQVSLILDDDLSIGSAGLLKMGGVAWVSVEVPDNIVTPSGVVFRPHLLAATSLDGSMSTTYKRCVTNVVCDNTMAAGLAEQGQVMRIRHSRHSAFRLNDVRAALEIVHTIGDDFTEQVETLTNVAVSEGDWNKFLDELVPLVDPKTGTAKEGRGLTMAENKRSALHNLWHHDERVAPWAHTAFGVVQAVNTYEQHVRGGKTGLERAHVNQMATVTGKYDKLDGDTLKTLTGVLEPAA